MLHRNHCTTSMVFINIGCCCCTDNKEHIEYVELEDDQTSGHKSVLGGLPEVISFNLTFSGFNTVNLRLSRNDRINVDVPVYFFDSPNEPIIFPPLQVRCTIHMQVMGYLSSGNSINNVAIYS